MAAKKPPVAKGKAVPPKGKVAARNKFTDKQVAARNKFTDKQVAASNKFTDKQVAARNKFKEMIAKKKEAAAKKK
jgi:hypothetical protein